MKKTAKWIKINIYKENNIDSLSYFCSNCKFINSCKIGVCSNCGCHMKNTKSKEK